MRDIRAATPCDGIGVQWTQAPVGQPGNPVRQVGKHELGGEQHAHAHPDDSPYHRHDRELPDDFLVVSRLLLHACSLELRQNPNCGNAACASTFVFKDVIRANVHFYMVFPRRMLNDSTLS